MSENRINLNDEELEKVTGGLFDWYPKYNIMDYTHADGTVTRHVVLDYKNAWKMSNALHGDLVPEDQILAQLIAAGYIQG